MGQIEVVTMTGPWWAPAGSDAVGNGVPTATTWLRSTDSVAKEAKSWLEDLEWSVLIKREYKFIGTACYI